jgi:hypothetical protein
MIAGIGYKNLYKAEFGFIWFNFILFSFLDHSLILHL